jgi:hypothetical protein
VSLVSLTPTPARFIDPRGQRFGAAVSAVVLVVAFLLNLPWLAAVVGLNLLVSAAFGTRLFLPGRAWSAIRRAARLGATEPEHEYPPRFAQAMGGTILALASLAFVLGFAPLGWLLAIAVAALQAVLAVTGICIGCRMYFLRWWVPSQFARLARRTDGLQPVAVPALERVK